MNKKRWLFLAIIILLIVGWCILFYKTYTNQVIAKSADIVMAVDVKRNAATLFRYAITTPSEWRIGNMFRPKNNEVFDWKDAIEIPDYLFVFHAKNQPLNVLHSVLTIKDEAAFAKGLTAYNFVEINMQKGRHTFFSEKLGVAFVKQANQILICNQPQFIDSIATEIFDNKTYFDNAILKNIVAQPNHFSIYFRQNNFLKNDAIIQGDFINGELVMKGVVEPNPIFKFVENKFKVSNNSLLNIACTQPCDTLYKLISSANTSATSKALGFSVDSLFSSSHQNYFLNINEIKPRIDSAISYTYDDDFNKIEKVVVNKVDEPSFNFTIQGTNNGIFNYWKQNKNIESTDAGNLFTPIPFAKTYVQHTETSTTVTTKNYVAPTDEVEQNCLAFLSVNAIKITPSLMNYLPTDLKKIVDQLEGLKAVATTKNKMITINISIVNKIKNKPFLWSINHN